MWWNALGDKRWRRRERGRRRSYSNRQKKIGTFYGGWMMRWEGSTKTTPNELWEIFCLYDPLSTWLLPFQLQPVVISLNFITFGRSQSDVWEYRHQRSHLPFCLSLHLLLFDPAHTTYNSFSLYIALNHPMVVSNCFSFSSFHFQWPSFLIGNRSGFVIWKDL